MNMRLLTSVIAFAMILLLAGCSSVTIPHPLSAHPKPVDKEKFEGTWIVGKGTLNVKFASNGVGRIAGTEWKNDHFRLIRGEMVVTEGQRNNYISVRFEEDGAWKNRYNLLQYKFTDHGDLILWLPNVDAFESAVKTNALQGVVTKDQHRTSISITNTAASLLDFMDDPERRDLFKYTEPMVLIRVTAPEKAE